MILTVAVMDDPALSEALRRLSAEWTARTDVKLNIEANDSPFDGSLPGRADVLIYPPSYMGQWMEQKAIVPLRARILERQGYEATDLLAVPGNPLTRWGERAMAISLGCPLPVLYYRRDALAAIEAEPPGTWSEYARVADRLRYHAATDRRADGRPAVRYAALEPVAGLWAANMLMVRVASAVIDAGQVAALFEMESMKARIAEPPFVRALEEMTQAGGAEPPVAFDPAQARRSVLLGDAGMAISWPTATADVARGSAQPVGIAPVPVSRQVYGFSTRQWRPRPVDEHRHVPVLGLEGRLASVTSASRNAPAAFQWLAWIGGPELSARIATQSPATTLFRRSHLADPARWVESNLPPAAVAAYARVVRHLAQENQWMMGLRIPGRQRYLSALAAAVRQTLTDAVRADTSLADASRQWEAITDAVGRGAQKEAYRSSLGL